MSAETLRRAAALMRERGEGATPGPWETCKGVVSQAVDAPDDLTAFIRVVDSARSFDPAIDNAAHIASWHPAVALAVAAWLEVTARDVGTSSTAYHAALAVARAYLGEDA